MSIRSKLLALLLAIFGFATLVVSALPLGHLNSRRSERDLVDRAALDDRPYERSLVFDPRDLTPEVFNLLSRAAQDDYHTLLRRERRPGRKTLKKAKAGGKAKKPAPEPRTKVNTSRGKVSIGWGKKIPQHDPGQQNAIIKAVKHVKENDPKYHKMTRFNMIKNGPRPGALHSSHSVDPKMHVTGEVFSGKKQVYATRPSTGEKVKNHHIYLAPGQKHADPITGKVHSGTEPVVKTPQPKRKKQKPGMEGKHPKTRG